MSREYSGWAAPHLNQKRFSKCIRSWSWRLTSLTCTVSAVRRVMMSGTRASHHIRTEWPARAQMRLSPTLIGSNPQSTRTPCLPGPSRRSSRHRSSKILAVPRTFSAQSRNAFTTDVKIRLRLPHDATGLTVRKTQTPSLLTPIAALQTHRPSGMRKIK